MKGFSMKKITLALMIALFSFGSVAQDEKQEELKDYIQRCEIGNGAACWLAADLFQDLGKLEQAVEFFAKSCLLETGAGCFNLGVAFTNGEGAEQDDFKAAEFFSKACSLGDRDGCFYLGLAYALGEGAKQDYSKAVELFTKGCTLDDGNACFTLGLSHANGLGVIQDNEKALEYFGRACDLKNLDGCKAYAELKTKI